jgi:amino acid adenylation domain-containing protein
MTDLGNRISALSPGKQRLLEMLRKKGAAAPASGPAPRPRSEERPVLAPFALVAEEDRERLPPGLEDAYPLTMVQLGMLYHMELTPDATTPAYHNVNSFHLKAPLDLTVFDTVVQRIIARHPVLRTSFDLTSYSEPLQLVHRSAYLPVHAEDLREVPAAEQKRRLHDFIARENRRLVDLSRAPLIRFHVHRRSEEGFQLTLTEPHAISDGWSTMLTLTEIFDTYFALLRGEPLPEEQPVAASFRDFVFLERQALRSEETRGFWTRQLADLSLERLPRWPGRARPPRSEEEHKPTIEVRGALMERLEEVGARAQASLKSVLLAAHVKVLSLMSGTAEVVTGLTSHGRPEGAGGDQVRGLFLNTVPLRVRLGSERWLDLIQGVFQSEMEIYPHRRYPLAALQRLHGGQAIFEAIFTYLHFHSVRQVVRPGGLGLGEGHSDLSVTHFPLAATFTRDPLGDPSFTLTLEHNDPDLSLAQILVMQGTYRRVLEAIAEDPLTRHADASLLAPEERQQILNEWNDTAADYDLDRCLHELFEESVRRSPDAVAVVGEEGELTYGELNRRANQVAHALIEAGVAPGALVGLYLGRGLDMVIAPLGILKAGGAYVPLSADWPEARIEWVLAHLGARHLVTRTDRLDAAERLRGSLPGLAHVLCVDRLSGRPDSDPPRQAGPGDLAYVIFTSGSTGTPKGVAVRHRPVVNLIAWALPAFGFGPEDRVLFITSLSFDLSVFDVFGLLAAGGSIRVASSRDLQEPERLLAILRDEPVTFWDSAPAALQQLAPLFPATEGLRASRLRLVFLSGDWIPLSLPDQVRGHLPGARVVSLGGATEATVWSNWFPVREVDPRWASIPYGRPMPNARYHVLDAALRPAPVGTPGDLYIGGECVTSGYLGEPTLTAEKYVPDPFGPEPGGRLYRTGDRARHWPSGLLEFLGRLDHQVKIRGFRIELGEIEAVLAEQEGVRDAVVLAREDVPGQRRLVAYYTAESETPPQPEELRHRLERTLPAWMIPTAFVPMDSFPVTANGKLDRKALPEPGVERSTAELVAPRNDVERTIAAVWAEVLGRESVGIQESFFALGGHSLLAIQLIARLRETLRVDIPLGGLFEGPTVAELAALVVRSGIEAAHLPLVLPRIEPAPGRLHEPFPLLDLQQAYWLGRRTDLDLGGVSAHTYQELELEDLDVERFEAAWRRLIDRHPMLRAVVLPDGTQVILERTPPFSIEVLDLRGLSAEERDEAVAAVRARMAGEGPDPERWPLFEVVVCRTGERRSSAHVSLSLLIVDAVSVGVLIRELPRFYADPNLELPPLEVTFRDAVLALRRLEGTAAWQASLRYWTDRLPELPPSPELPFAPVPASPRQARFVRQTFALEAGAWARIKARAGRAGVTPTVAVLAAYSRVLAAWSKSPRFTLNVLFFNRPPLHPRITDVVGNFSSTLLLEVDASGERFEAAAQGVQERLWSDMEHAAVSGVRVLRELNRLQHTGARPAMPVVFTSDLNVAGGDGEAPEEIGFSGGALQTPQVWLDHQVSERAGRLVVSWDAVEEVFLPGVIPEMFAAYRRLLEALGAEEDVWRSRTPLLVPAEQLAQMAAVNATGEAAPEALLHAAFEEQARRQPDAPALLAAGRSLTQGELAGLARRVGRRLRGLGARPDTLVAVVMEKGWEQAVAALGVVWSGAAYLPIDPRVPGERLRYLLANGGVSVALTQERFLDALEWPAEVKRLTVAEEDPGADEEHLAPAGRPEDLAYVIFTSGSTGLPKGVAIEHRAAANTLRDMERRFGLGPDDRVLGLSALHFDLSVWDLFGLLGAGGALVLPEPEELREPARWLELMTRHRVTVWNTVPALMEMLVDHLEGTGARLPSSLRLVLLSGDWIPVGLPDRIRALGQNVEVVSLGGATEASIWSICHPIREVDPAWTSIPYGRPLAGQSFHVLGENLEPRPFLVPGELYVGGAGLAREYWRDAERTSASFVVHPETGERLYRTGDLGRRLPDGAIEFLGREDLQVKVQGYRIELGEIEAALAQHPAVRACTVAALGEKRGSKRLVAYLVASGEAPGAEELSGFLGRKLPAHMIPTAFVALDAIPLTSNGKVDRRALPEPERLAEQAAGRVPPRDELEARLAAIWEDLLGAAPVGVLDDFFDLGGHSLMAVRLMTQIRTETGVDLPLSTLFEAGTIERLAALLRSTAAGSSDSPAPARSPLVQIRRGAGLPLFLVHPVGGGVLCYRELARSLGGAEPVWGIQADEETEARTLEEMAAAYLRTVREIWPHGPYRLGGWSMGGTLAFEMARQLRQAGGEVDLVFLIDPSAPGAAGPVAVDDATLASWFAHDLGGLAGIELEVRPEDLRGLEPAAEAERLLELAREARVLPPGLEAEAVRRRLNAFRRNYQALLAYSPAGRGVPLALFVAEEGTAEVAPWQALSHGDLDVERIPGDHYSIVQPPAVQVLAARLRACLDAAAVTLGAGQ